MEKNKKRKTRSRNLKTWRWRAVPSTAVTESGKRILIIIVGDDKRFG